MHSTSWCLMQEPDLFFKLLNVSCRGDPDVKSQLKPEERLSVRNQAEGVSDLLVWNNIGLNSSIDYGEVDSVDISKYLAGVRI